MKILVAHPAQQHSYRLAAALKKKRMLWRYVTTVYYKKKSFTAFIAFFLNDHFRSKALSRRCKDLSDQDVIQYCEAEGLLKLLALNTPFFYRYYREIKYNTADRFARKTARYAIRSNVDAVITYDDTSPLLFEIIEKKSPDTLRIMDMSAANILYMRHIYEKDIKIAPAFENRLRNERKICWDPKTIERTKRELRTTQYFIVPSEFVGRSLEFSGIRPDQIYYCPYGVDISEFSQKKYQKNFKDRRTLEFIYVGGVKELKGIYYLLEAFSKIPKDKAFLTVVGNYDPSDVDIAPYTEFVKFTGMVLHSDIPKLLQKADVFVLPSLGEGFTLAAMEAASCGLPLILSENTGVNDLITDGVQGFTIPIQSVDALVEKIQFFIDHPEQICLMGANARKMAEQHTWDRYNAAVTETIEKIIAADSEKKGRV